MRDYDSTVKNLREAAKGLLFDAMPYRASVMRDAADAIEELLAELTTIRKQLPRWISVEDELPKLGERVLITNGSFVCESYQSQGKRWMRHGCYMDYMQPTHWMPLPAPPKGVE